MWWVVKTQRQVMPGLHERHSVCCYMPDVRPPPGVSLIRDLKYWSAARCCAIQVDLAPADVDIIVQMSY